MDINKDLKRTVLAMAMPVYIPILMISCIIPSLFEKKIRSQKELDKILDEETPKLGLSDIKGRLYEKHAGMVGDDGTIKIGGFEAKRTFVRHELYHKSMHKDCDFKDKFDYFFRMEPQAILYQYGLKI